MKKETMTMKQMMFVLIMFLFGNTAMIGLRTGVDQDSWISMLIAIAAVIPVVVMYARIMKLYPGQNLFDAMQNIFKPVIGKILIVLMLLYALFLASSVICLFNNFIRISSLINTPRLAVSISFLFAALYLALSKIDTLGKGSITVFILLISTITITLFMSLPELNFDNFYPIANHSLKQLADGAWKIIAMPLCESVLILGFVDMVKRKRGDSPYRVFVYAILIIAIIVLLIHLRNILLIGSDLWENSYFPSYRASRLLGIKNFLERIEGLLTYNFIIGGIAKLTVCLLFAAKGATKLFGLKDYKTLVPPISLLLISLCLLGNDNIIQIYDFMEVYQYFALPFQIIIPLIVWIGAEIKTRNNRIKENDTESVPEP